MLLSWCLPLSLVYVSLAGPCKDLGQSEGEDLMKCQDMTREGESCKYPCGKSGEEYNWCYTFSTAKTNAWEYCAHEGNTTRDEVCVGECSKGGDGYWWCRTDNTDETKGDFCAPPRQEVRIVHASNGQLCLGECATQGEDYTWCYKAQKFSAYKNQDYLWEYCSEDPHLTSEKEQCKDECATRGELYFWCNTNTGSWGYCSPPMITTMNTDHETVFWSNVTRGGNLCYGVCDNYSSSYKYCNTNETNTVDWWDYCGTGGAGVQPTFSITLSMILVFLVIFHSEESQI